MTTDLILADSYAKMADQMEQNRRKDQVLRMLNKEAKDRHLPRLSQREFNMVWEAALAIVCAPLREGELTMEEAVYRNHFVKDDPLVGLDETNALANEP